MKIELKNVKTVKRLSEETPCYVAVVYVDGKAAVDVSNRGHGGCDEQHARKGFSVADLDAYIAANMPPLDMSEYGMADIPATLESWCHLEIDVAKERDRFARLMKSNICHVTPKGVVMVGYKGVRVLEQRHFDHFAKDHQGVVTLNSMPFDEAWTIAKPLILGGA